MLEKEYILFDLDGTITDPYEGITKAVAYALKRFGIETQDRTQLKLFIGPPLYASFMEYASLSMQQAEDAVRYYREYYVGRGVYECFVYSGIPDLFEALCRAGKRLVLATSKPEYFAFDLMRHFGLDKYFYKMYGATLDSSRVEKSDVIRAAVLDGMPADRSVMIGDRKFDISGAAQNGIAGIGVSYGYGSAEELLDAGAVFVCESPEQIRHVLL